MNRAFNEYFDSVPPDTDPESFAALEDYRESISTLGAMIANTKGQPLDVKRKLVKDIMNNPQTSFLFSGDMSSRTPEEDGVAVLGDDILGKHDAERYRRNIMNSDNYTAIEKAKIINMVNKSNKILRLEKKEEQNPTLLKVSGSSDKVRSLEEFKALKNSADVAKASRENS
jgi:hypothetical protein